MKQKRVIYYRISSILLILPVFGLLLMSYSSRNILDDVWKQLGVSEKDGQYDIGASFKEGFPYSYSARNAKNIATGDRIAVLKNVLEYTKKFINSPEFQKEYEQFRNSKKPSAPQAFRTKEQIRDEMVKSTEESIKSIEAAIKTTTDASTKKSFEGTLADLRKNLQDYKSPNNEMINLMYESGKTAQRNYQDSYEKDLAKWEANFPATPQLLAKKRLQSFLDLTQGIDFNAALKEGRGGNKVFVNPAYERKDNKWKMAYRAGKEMTEVARAFAQQWLKELN